MEYKKEYGFVETPEYLVNRMLDLLDIGQFKNDNKKWLDTGCGKGVFSYNLVKRFLNRKKEELVTMDELTKNSFNIDLVEINKVFEEDLQLGFQNVYIEDYLNFSKNDYDYVIGNPPYNYNGLKKVPTNKNMTKKDDGKTLWINFLYKSIEILKPGGILCYIIPNIWMKNNHLVYKYLINFKIEKIVPFTNTESNKLFNGNCQTPTCIIILRKVQGDGKMCIYDKLTKDFEYYDSKFRYHLPLQGVYIVSKMNEYVDKYGSIIDNIRKTNVVSKRIKLNSCKSSEYSYKNIETCLLNNAEPYLKFNYSNRPCSYHGVKKLILAHKMYGFPYMDLKGEYGISKRDNYVLIDLNDDDSYLKVQKFFTTGLGLFLMETTRYRMKYLEKYMFDFVPNIINMKDYPNTDDSIIILKYFGIDLLDDSDKKMVMMRQSLRKYLDVRYGNFL